MLAGYSSKLRIGSMLPLGQSIARLVIAGEAYPASTDFSLQYLARQHRNSVCYYFLDKDGCCPPFERPASVINIHGDMRQCNGNGSSVLST